MSEDPKPQQPPPVPKVQPRPRPKMRREDVIRALSGVGIGMGAGALGEFALRGKVTGWGLGAGALAGIGGTHVMDRDLFGRMKQTYQDQRRYDVEEPKRLEAERQRLLEERDARMLAELEAQRKAEQQDFIREDMAFAQSRQDFNEQVARERAQSDWGVAASGADPRSDTMEIIDSAFGMYSKAPDSIKNKFERDALQDIAQIQPYRVMGEGAGAVRDIQAMPDAVRLTLLQKYGAAYMAKYGKRPTKEMYEQAEKVLGNDILARGGQVVNPAQVGDTLAKLVVGRGLDQSLLSLNTMSYVQDPESGAVIPAVAAREGGWDRTGGTINELYSQMTRNPDIAVSTVGGQVAQLAANRIMRRRASTQAMEQLTKTTGKKVTKEMTKELTEELFKDMAKKGSVFVELADSALDSYMMLATNPETGQITKLPPLDTMVSNLQKASPAEMETMKAILDVGNQVAQQREYLKNELSLGRIGQEDYDKEMGELNKSKAVSMAATALTFMNVPRPALAKGHQVATEGSPGAQMTRTGDFYRGVQQLGPVMQQRARAIKGLTDRLSAGQIDKEYYENAVRQLDANSNVRGAENIAWGIANQIAEQDVTGGYGDLMRLLNQSAMGWSAVLGGVRPEDFRAIQEQLQKNRAKTIFESMKKSSTLLQPAEVNEIVDKATNGMDQRWFAPNTAGIGETWNPADMAKDLYTGESNFSRRVNDILYQAHMRQLRGKQRQF